MGAYQHDRGFSSQVREACLSASIQRRGQLAGETISESLKQEAGVSFDKQPRFTSDRSHKSCRICIVFITCACLHCSDAPLSAASFASRSLRLPGSSSSSSTRARGFEKRASAMRRLSNAQTQTQAQLALVHQILHNIRKGHIQFFEMS